MPGEVAVRVDDRNQSSMHLMVSARSEVWGCGQASLAAGAPTIADGSLIDDRQIHLSGVDVGSGSG